jgi:hypothetical protein
VSEIEGEEETPALGHLEEFRAGFAAGYRGEKRATGRSGTYRRAYDRGKAAANLSAL